MISTITPASPQDFSRNTKLDMFIREIHWKQLLRTERIAMQIYIYHSFMLQAIKFEKRKADVNTNLLKSY